MDTIASAAETNAKEASDPRGSAEDALSSNQANSDPHPQYATESELLAHTGNMNNPHSTTKAQVGLDNVTNDTQVKRSEMGVSGGVATLGPDAKLSSDQIPSSVVGDMEYKGAWDCSSGVYPSNPSKGDFYVVSVAGTISGNSYALKDSFAYNGTSWDRFVGSIPVTSVAGKTGVVELDKNDVGLTNVTDDAQLKRSAGDIDTFTEKTTLVDADEFLIEDSASRLAKKKTLWSTITSVLKRYFDTIYLETPFYYNVTNYGISANNTHGQNTAAWTALVEIAKTANRMKFYFPGSATYLGTFDISGLGSDYTVHIRGDGFMSSILKSDRDMVLDISSTSRVNLEDIQIMCDGNPIGILAARYTISPSNQPCANFKRVRISGNPTIAGYYHIGYEVTHHESFEIVTTGNAPTAIVSGYNLYGPLNLAYNSPNGTIVSPASQETTRFGAGCRFVKNGVRDTGPALEIGAAIFDLSFDHCYFNGAPGSNIIAINTHGAASPIYNLKLKELAFESNFCGDGQGATAIGSEGNVTGSYLEHPVIEDCYLYQRRATSGSYDIDFLTVPIELRHARIRNNKSANGGGARFATLSSSTEVEWHGKMTTLSAPIVAGTNYFLVSDSSHTIRQGDWVGVGQSFRYDGIQAPRGYGQEVKQVDHIDGATIYIAGTFGSQHENAEFVEYSVMVVDISMQNEITSFARPRILTADFGTLVKTCGIDRDMRYYFGPGFASQAKQAPVIVNRAFGDAPNSPENGMFVTAIASGAWTTTTNIDGWTQTNFPVFYSGRFYVLPLALRGNAAEAIPEIVDGGHVDFTITATGASLGDFATASLSVAMPSGVFMQANVTGTNTVVVGIYNLSGSPVTIGATTVEVVVVKH